MKTHLILLSCLFMNSLSVYAQDEEVETIKVKKTNACGFWVDADTNLILKRVRLESYQFTGLKKKEINEIHDRMRDKLYRGIFVDQDTLCARYKDIVKVNDYKLDSVILTRNFRPMDVNPTLYANGNASVRLVYSKEKKKK